MLTTSKFANCYTPKSKNSIDHLDQFTLKQDMSSFSSQGNRNKNNTKRCRVMTRKGQKHEAKKW